MTLTTKEKKAYAEFHNNLIKKIEEKVKRRMNILKYDTRLKQKMENEIKKSLSNTKVT